MIPVLRESNPAITISSLTLDDVRTVLFQDRSSRLDDDRGHQRTSPPKRPGASSRSGLARGRRLVPNPTFDLPACRRTSQPRPMFPIPAQLQDSVDALRKWSRLRASSPDYYPVTACQPTFWAAGFYATRLISHDLRQVTSCACMTWTSDKRMPGRPRTFYSVTYACDPQNVSKARGIDPARPGFRTRKETSRRPNFSRPKGRSSLHTGRFRSRNQARIASRGDCPAAPRSGCHSTNFSGLANQYYSMTAEQVRAAFAQTGCVRTASSAGYPWAGATIGEA